MGKKRTNGKDRLKAMFLVKQFNRCFYCPKILTLVTATLDHITPKSKGGSNNPRNLCVCCYPCNLKKGSMNPLDFLIKHYEVQSRTEM